MYQLRLLKERVVTNENFFENKKTQELQSNLSYLEDGEADGEDREEHDDAGEEEVLLEDPDDDGEGLKEVEGREHLVEEDLEDAFDRRLNHVLAVQLAPVNHAFGSIVSVCSNLVVQINIQYSILRVYSASKWIKRSEDMGSLKGGKRGPAVNGGRTGRPAPRR